MTTVKKKPLFEMASSEIEGELEAMFEPLRERFPIRYQVGCALMAAEIAAQRFALKAMDSQFDASGAQKMDMGALAAATQASEEVYACLIGDGQGSRLDGVLWDAEGYVHGWFLGDAGRPAPQLGSCPENIARLAVALQIYAEIEDVWRLWLTKQAVGLAALLKLSREKAYITARERVAAKGWWRRLIAATTVEREMVSLGFQ